MSIRSAWANMAMWQVGQGGGDVGAIRMLSANDLRRRWVSTLAIALLIGVVAATVVAAVAGARRSGSALRRFNAESRSATVEVEVGTPTEHQVRAFEAAIGSAPVGLIHVYGISPIDRPSVAMATSVDGSFGTMVDRPRLIAGRAAAPDAVDEATISESLAQQTGIKVGSMLPAQSISPKQLAHGDFSPKGPKPSFRVVGIVRRPADLSDLAASGGLITLTPAFDRAYAGRIALFTLDVRVRVQGGAAAVGRVVAVARHMFGSSESFRVDNPSTENNGAQNAIDVLTAALWIFASVAAAAAILAVSIVVFRDVAQGRPQQSTLRSMGLTRSGRVAATLPRVLLMGVAGAAVAVIGAIALSPLLPFGIARRADPDPGLHADWLALGLGAGAVLVVVLGTGLAASIRTTRIDTGGGQVRQGRSMAEMLAIPRLRPTIANGVRMALDPGRDERAVPVRSAFAGAILGVLGVVAVLVFAASLAHLGDTPRLYGWTWDVKAQDPATPPRCNGNSFEFERRSGVSAVAAICSRGLSIEGRDTIVWGYTPIRGSIGPAIVTGHAPAGDDEIALGLDTLKAVHKHMGDTVRVGHGQAAIAFRIVGRAVFPPMTYGNVQHLADGATLTGAGFARLVPTPDEATTRYVVARVAPAERTKVAQELRALLIRSGGDPKLAGEAVGGPTRPPELDRIRHVAWLLPTLAILMIGLALVAVAHALITTARRRRHELAVFKALGFERRQVRATLAWEATTLAVVGAALGIPAGVVVGRLTWSFVADDLGVASTLTVPVLALALTVPATLLVVNAVAYVPARAAARTRTSIALAAE